VASLLFLESEEVNLNKHPKNHRDPGPLFGEFILGLKENIIHHHFLKSAIIIHTDLDNIKRESEKHKEGRRIFLFSFF
jgi:hypothetical protein